MTTSMLKLQLFIFQEIMGTCLVAMRVVGSKHYGHNLFGMFIFGSRLYALDYQYLLAAATRYVAF
jgi:hypothetical protein